MLFGLSCVHLGGLLCCSTMLSVHLVTKDCLEVGDRTLRLPTSGPACLYVAVAVEYCRTSLDSFLEPQ
jgi:hypothetical protein